MATTVRQTGGDYGTLNAACAAGEVSIDIDQAWTIADTTAVVINTPGTTVTVSGGAVHPGYISGGDYYRLEVSGGHCIQVDAGGFSIIGVVLGQLGAGDSDEGIRVTAVAGSTTDIVNCLIYAAAVAVTNQDGIYIQGSIANRTVNIEQTLIYNFGRNGINFYTGTDAVTLNLNSIGVSGCGGGGTNYAGGICQTGVGAPTVDIINIQNCFACGNLTRGDYYNRPVHIPVWSISNSIDSDNSIAGLINAGGNNLPLRTITDSDAPGAGSWLIVEDVTTYPFDFRLKDNAQNDAQDAHANASVHGLTIPALDIVGTSRPQNTLYDIGDFELEVGGPGPIDITIQDIEQASELENVTLSRGRGLTIQDIEQASELDNVTLSRGRGLTIQDIEQASELENVVLSLSRGLTIQDIEQASELENVLVRINLEGAQTYISVSGQPIIAGRAAVPSWIASQIVGTWGTVPAPLIDTLDPTDAPEINPSYPASQWGQYRQRMNAWCGGCFDDSPAAPTFHIPIGGGHSDYMTNDDTRINLAAEIPRWTCHHWPSGARPDAILLDDGQEASGLYLDGGIRPPHTYNKPVFVPGVGCFLSVQGLVSFSGQVGTSRVVRFEPGTGLGALLASNPFAGTMSGTGACYDPTRGTQGSIWSRGRALGVMSRYDVALDSWTSHGGNVNVSADTALEYLPGDDLLIWINTGLSQSFGVFNPANNTYTYPGFSGSFIGMTLSGQSCPSWSEAHNGFLIWDNSSSTTTINLINKPANPRTDPWPISQLAVDPSNTITPSVRAANGTYGRAFYSASLGCFFVVNSTTTPFYFFRIA